MRIEGVELLNGNGYGGSSICNYTDYARYFKYLTLRPVNKIFPAYTGTPLDITRQILVDMEYNDQQLTLPLLIVGVKTYAPPLLERAWMTKIRLDWRNLFSPSNGQFVLEPDNVNALYA